MADAATRQRMQAIAAGLTAAGLTACLHETNGRDDLPAGGQEPRP